MTLQNKPSDIPRPNGNLSGACYDALICIRSLPISEHSKKLGCLSFDNLDALERVEKYNFSIKANLKKLHELLTKASKIQLEISQIDELLRVYNSSLDIAFPITQSFLHWSHNFHGISQEYNLESISLPKLRQLEEDSFVDASLRGLLKEFEASLSRINGLQDSQGFRQAFEFYGEALVYSLLSAKFNTQRIAAKSSPMPDFSCTLPNGKKFFLELKSFDIVDGQFRSEQLHEDAIQQQIELEKQLLTGKKIAIATREIEPYKRAFAKAENHDPYSLLTVINTLINKARSAFKPTQFAQGPTFAVALCDRLLIPDGKYSVAPNYFEKGGAAIVSGVLWNVCFGKEGWPISRMPHFEGLPGIEGYMVTNGLLSDAQVAFPSHGIIFIETTYQEENVLGLFKEDSFSAFPSWNLEDTVEVMSTLCSSFNNEHNSYGQLVNHS